MSRWRRGWAPALASTAHCPWGTRQLRTATDHRATTRRLTWTGAALGWHPVHQPGRRGLAGAGPPQRRLLLRCGLDFYHTTKEVPGAATASRTTTAWKQAPVTRQTRQRAFWQDSCLRRAAASGSTPTRAQPQWTWPAAGMAQRVQPPQTSTTPVGQRESARPPPSPAHRRWGSCSDAHPDAVTSSRREINIVAAAPRTTTGTARTGAPKDSLVLDARQHRRPPPSAASMLPSVARQINGQATTAHGEMTRPAGSAADRTIKDLVPGLPLRGLDSQSAGARSTLSAASTTSTGPAPPVQGGRRRHLDTINVNAAGCGRRRAHQAAVRWPIREVGLIIPIASTDTAAPLLSRSSTGTRRRWLQQGEDGIRTGQ